MNLSLYIFAAVFALPTSWVTSAFSAATTTKPTPVMEMDVTKAFEASTFPISPEELIIKAKEALGPDLNLGMADGGACLADDFQFCAAVVGPIGKKEYLNALGTFKLTDSFDVTPNFFGFTVSPVQPSRVYFFSHQEATMKAPFLGAKPEDLKVEKLILPPQCHFIDFDENGKLKQFGFYTVDRNYGNTGGLGGAFGFCYGVGKPLPVPECQPFKPSFRYRMLSKIGNFLQKFKKE